MAGFSPNLEQANFINSDCKNILVSASAGSGKTSTMIQKILHLLDVTKTPINNFMVVTYTNAAASEIKQKLYKVISEKISSATTIEEKNYLKNELDNINNSEIGTLHAICKKLIVKYFYELGQSPDFKLLNEKEAGYLYESAIEKVFKNYILSEDKSFFDLYDCYNSKRNDVNLKNIVLKLKTFLDAKTDYIVWKNDFLNSSYTDDLNNNIACVFVFDYYKKQFEVLLKEFSFLIRECGQLSFDKYINFLQIRKNFIESFIGAENFEQAVKICNNFLPDRKPSKSKNANVEEEMFDEKVANFNADFKSVIENFSSSIVSSDLNEIKNSLTASKKNIVKLFDICNEINIEYTRLKSSKNSLDFNDLENKMLELLNNEKIKDSMSSYYKFIFVDEYQDINEKQENILNKLLKDNCYYMIGDVKQSIYAFRQSSPQIFISKYTSFSKDNKDNVVINFNTNYRSEKNILEFANLVFDNLITTDTIGIDYKKDARFQSEKSLSNCRVDLSILNLSESESDSKEEAEALLIAEKIAKIKCMKKEDGTNFDYKDIAIILRSRGSFVKTLCDTFKSLQIPVTAQIRSDFFKTYEIQFIINLLKAVSNFKDDIALVSVLKNLFDLSEEDLLKIRNFSENKYFYECVLSYNIDDVVLQKIGLFFKFIEKYRDIFANNTIYETLQLILDEFDLLLKFKSLPNGLERVENVNEFLTISDNENYEYSVDKFLEYLEYVSKDNTLQTIGNTGNAVQICTIHHSKGLEYPAVILAGMGKKFQTNKDSSEIIISNTFGVGLKDIDGANRITKETIVRNACKLSNKKGELDEEIRLLYVAMTRAREYLYLVGGYNVDNIYTLAKKDIYACQCYWDMVLKSIDKVYYSSFENVKEFVINEHMSTEAYVHILQVDDFELDNKNVKNRVIFDSVDNTLLEALNDIKRNIPCTDTFTIKNTVTNILTDEKDYENLNFNPNKLDVSDKLDNVDALKLGTAYHLIMQHVNFTENLELVNVLILSLVSAEKISLDVAKLVDAERILKCIETMKPLVIKAKEIYKEKQFLLQENYNKLVKNSDNNTKVIVQGVIDNVLIFENDAYLIDYKTNKTTNEEFLKEHYKLQLDIYKTAFEKATGINITKKFLYSFYLNKLIAVD